MTGTPPTIHGAYPKIPTLFKRDPSTKQLTSEYRTGEIAALSSLPWDVQEKVDGTNVRVHWDGHKVYFRGRTDKAQAFMPDLQAALEHRFGGEGNAQLFEERFGETPVTLYGEGFGGRIQKTGPQYSETPDFVLFDVRIGGTLNPRWMADAEIDAIAEGLGHIPKLRVLQTARPSEAADLVRGGFKSDFGTADAEGIVLRPPFGLRDRYGHRIIAKLKVSDVDG